MEQPDSEHQICAFKDCQCHPNLSIFASIEKFLKSRPEGSAISGQRNFIPFSAGLSILGIYFLSTDQIYLQQKTFPYFDSHQSGNSPSTSSSALIGPSVDSKKKSDLSFFPHRMPSLADHSPLLPLPMPLHIDRSAEPTTVSSLRHLVLGSYFNTLLVFVPLCLICPHLGLSTSWQFSFSFLAIIPLAKLLGDATEQVSLRLGSTLGGLLNASFGNAVELIVGIIGLQQNQFRIVQTSLLGSMLSNLVLVLGMSFIAGGMSSHENNFLITAVQTSSSLVQLSVIALIIPTVYKYSYSSGATESSGVLAISRLTAAVMVFIYGCYLYFQLRSHKDLFDSRPPSLVEDDEEMQDPDAEKPEMTTNTALLSLLVITIITSFCADVLVSSIDDFSDRFDVPKTFIGLILLPLVANAAEHMTAVWMAYKGKMEITIGVSIGSTIQIALGLLPTLVLLGWAMDKKLSLAFTPFETIITFLAAFFVGGLVQDGKSNWLEGTMLTSLYIIIAVGFWWS